MVPGYSSPAKFTRQVMVAITDGQGAFAICHELAQNDKLVTQEVYDENESVVAAHFDGQYIRRRGRNGRVCVFVFVVIRTHRPFNFDPR